MPYQRPIFATMALLYCVCLGIFSLTQKPATKLNLNFALYNFANALYNMADYIIFIPSHQVAVWWLRIAGIGGSFMIAFLAAFVFDLTELSNNPRLKTLDRLIFGIAAFMSLMHLTPFFIADANYTYLKSSMSIEVGGPLYWIFPAGVLVQLIVLIIALPLSFKNTSHIQRQKFWYVLVACSVGFVAFSTYLLSFVGIDLPIIYYSLQALVAFIFSYAIFQHHMLPVSVALRRGSLMIGIYVLIGILLFPLIILARHTAIADAWGSFAALMITTGLLFSLGPLLYGWMIRRSAVFQDTAAAHITHEFKTPLSAIHSAKSIVETELAQKKPDAEKIRTYLEMIERNTQRLEGFVSNILQVTKGGEETREVSKETIDVRSFLESEAAAFPSHRIDLKFHADTPKHINGHAEGLHHVVSNLLSNAVKYGEGKIIKLTVSSPSSLLEIAVEDHGIGLPKQDLEKIFHPFVRSKTSTQIKGSGLGLAVAKRWVEQLRGRIWAESDGVGRGARFVVQVPLE